MADMVQLCRDLHKLSNSRIHLGVTGSIACYKSIELMRHLEACGVHVSVTVTQAAQHFVSPLLFRSLGASVVYEEMFTGEEPFAHLEPGQHANALFVVPASADLIARTAQGRANDMLAAQVLAFTGPVCMAPAMNVRMWENQATQENVALLQRRGVEMVLPESGKLACGEIGAGHLASMETLLAYSLKALSPQDMRGERVLITLGATREPWDGVRFWSNPSTGLMGASVALAAWLRGAQVEAIAGASVDKALLGNLPGLTVHHVQTAKEMYACAESLWAECSAGVFTAAVADFSPVPYGAKKFKKETAQEGFSVAFTPNPDILRSLCQRRTQQRVIGFAAETTETEEELFALARLKLERKGADIVAANRVNATSSGFAASTNAMAVVDKQGRQAYWPTQSKMDIGWELCSWLLQV